MISKAVFDSESCFPLVGARLQQFLIFVLSGLQLGSQLRSQGFVLLGKLCAHVELLSETALHIT